MVCLQCHECPKGEGGTLNVTYVQRFLLFKCLSVRGSSEYHIFTGISVGSSECPHCGGNSKCHMNTKPKKSLCKQEF